MSSLYGPHIINGASPHLADLARLQPNVALFLDPNPDDVAQFRAACPNTICIGRVYIPDSEVEQRICVNPEEAALWAHGLVLGHPARSWIHYWQIPNEVCQFADKLPLINRFFVRWMQLADASGYKCAVLGWSVGQIDMPANDRLALWKLVYPTCAYAEEHGHIGLVHGYGAPDLWGPPEKGGAPWLINRLEIQVLPLLPYKKLKFVYGEYGIDGLLLLDLGRSLAEIEDPGVGVRIPSKSLESYTVMAELEARGITGPSGWQNFIDATGYIKQLTDMGQWLAQFSNRILGYCIFTLGNNTPWGSYDIQGDVLRGLSYYYQNAPPVTPPVEPPVTAPTLAQRLKAEFGTQFVDLRASLVHGTPPYTRRALSAITAQILHHTAADDSVDWPAIAQYHVNSKGWPGIAYHVGIHANRQVALLNDLEVVSYHAGDANDHSAAICVAGNYEHDPVSDVLWRRVLDVSRVLNEHLGRTVPMLGHRDVTQTACPGKNLSVRLKTPEVPVAIKLGSYVDDFNLKIVPFEQRPDVAHWRDGPFYRIIQVFTTRDGSWEPSANLGSIDQWAVDAWHSGADWKGAGGTNNFFFKVLDKVGKVVPGKGLYYWQGPITDDPAKLTNVNQKTTWNDGTENLPVWDYYDPSKGEMGKWSGATIGRSDVLMGVDLPYKNHVSTFVVLQESDAEAQPEYPTLVASVKGEAERHDALSINPDAALCKAGAAVGLWPTSNEYAWTYAGVNYTGQRFRNPKNDNVSAFYCVTGDWGNVKRQDW